MQEGRPRDAVGRQDAAARGAGCARALGLDQAIGVLTSYDEGPDLVLYYKYLMVLEGNAEYTHHLNPTDSLTPGQKRYAEQQLALFKSWYRQWSAA